MRTSWRRLWAVVLFLLAIVALLVGFSGAMMTNWRGAPERDREIETYTVTGDGLVDLPADAAVEFGIPGSAVPEGERPATPSCTLHGPADELLEFTGGNAAFAGNTFWSFGHFTTTDAGIYRLTCGAFQDELIAQTYPWATADRERAEARTRVWFWIGGGTVSAVLLIWGASRVLRTPDRA